MLEGSEFLTVGAATVLSDGWRAPTWAMSTGTSATRVKYDDRRDYNCD